MTDRNENAFDNTSAYISQTLTRWLDNNIHFGTYKIKDNQINKYMEIIESEARLMIYLKKKSITFETGCMNKEKSFVVLKLFRHINCCCYCYYYCYFNFIPCQRILMTFLKNCPVCWPVQCYIIIFKIDWFMPKQKRYQFNRDTLYSRYVWWSGYFGLRWRNVEL